MNKAKLNTLDSSEKSQTITSQRVKQKLVKIAAAATLSLSLASCGTAENVKADSDPSVITSESPSSAVETPSSQPTQAPEIQSNTTPESVHEWLASEPQPIESASVTPDGALFIIQIPDFEESSQVYAIGSTVEWKEGDEDKVFSVATASSLEYTNGNAATFTDEEVLRQAAEHEGTVTVWATPLPGGVEGSVNEALSGGISSDALGELQSQVILYNDLGAEDQDQVNDLYTVFEEFNASELVN